MAGWYLDDDARKLNSGQMTMAQSMSQLDENPGESTSHKRFWMGCHFPGMSNYFCYSATRLENSYNSTPLLCWLVLDKW